jgi:hypothetical protein
MNTLKSHIKNVLIPTLEGKYRTSARIPGKKWPQAFWRYREMPVTDIVDEGGFMATRNSFSGLEWLESEGQIREYF